MKLWEAMKLLEEGKKVRQTTWDKKEFIHSPKQILNEENREIFLTNVGIDEEWEEYK